MGLNINLSKVSTLFLFPPENAKVGNRSIVLNTHCIKQKMKIKIKQIIIHSFST